LVDAGDDEDDGDDDDVVVVVVFVAWSNSRHVCDPIYPAPPVTNTVRSFDSVVVVDVDVVGSDGVVTVVVFANDNEDENEDDDDDDDDDDGVDGDEYDDANAILVDGVLVTATTRIIINRMQ
jgi:hypothetical protein